MYLQVTPITIVLLITTIFLLGLSYYLSLQKKGKGTQEMMFLLLAAAIWAFSIGVESTLSTIELRVLWSKISYFGVICIGPLWLLFALKYSETKGNLLGIIRWAMWAIPLITLILVLTNENHNLIWTDFHPILDKVEDGVIYVHGSYFMIHVIYTYSLILAGGFILARHVLTRTGYDRIRTIIFLLAMFFPWIANIIYVFISPTLFEVEITPIALLLSVIALIFGIMKYQALTAIPIAKESFFTQIEDVIIIMDEEGSVIDYNPFAKLIFKHLFVGVNLHTASEEEFFFIPEILKGERERNAYYHLESRKWFDSKIIKIKDSEGDILGEMLYLHDISLVKKAQRL